MGGLFGRQAVATSSRVVSLLAVSSLLAVVGPRGGLVVEGSSAQAAVQDPDQPVPQLP